MKDRWHRNGTDSHHVSNAASTSQHTPFSAKLTALQGLKVYGRHLRSRRGSNDEINASEPQCLHVGSVDAETQGPRSAGTIGIPANRIGALTL